MAVTVVRTMAEGDASLAIASNPVPVGNKLCVVGISGTAGNSLTVTDSDGANTYTRRLDFAGSDDNLEVWACDVSNEIEVADTVSHSGGSAPVYTGLIELSGMESGDSFDTSATVDGGFTAAQTVGPATPAVADSIAVAAFKQISNPTGTPPAGWTEFGELVVSSESVQLHYKRLMSTAAVSCTNTASGASNFDAVLAIFNGDGADFPSDVSRWGAAGTHAGTATSGAACAPTYPGSITAGNLLIYAACIRDNATSPDTPSGFTLLGGPYSTNGSTGRLWIYGKIATGSESGTESCGSQAVLVNRTAQIYRLDGDYTGATLSDVVAGFASTTPGASSTTVPDQDITTPEDYCVVYNLVYAADNNTMTPGAGWTEANDVNTTPGTGAMLWLGYVESAATMTVGGVNHTMSASDPFVVAGFYVKSPPAAGGTSETPTPGGATAAGVAPTARATVSVGGAVGAGTTPSPSVAVPQGGGDAQGVGPTARVDVTPGGGVAAGNPPDDGGGGISETPPPGGATAGGVSPAPQVAATAGGALGAGVGPTARTDVTAGGAAAAGNTPTSRTAVPQGGADAAGFGAGAAAPSGTGGAGGAGAGPAAAVAVTPGGATAGGNAPDDGSGAGAAQVTRPTLGVGV